MKSFYIESYGCSSSQNDADIISGLLIDSGLTSVPLSKSDFVIINTCIVKSVTESKIRSRISSIQKKFPHKKIILTGCMPEAELPMLRKNFPDCSLVGTNNIYKIAEAMKEKRVEFVGKIKKSKASLSKARNLPIDIVEIASGCSYACSFCITKLAKGNIFSYPSEEIVREIKSAYAAGSREFWITGQEVAGYKDIINLPELIFKIVNEVEGRYFIRIGMMHPVSLAKIKEGMIEVYRDPHIFKFLHLPLQSGSDAVLARMKRCYTAEQFVSLLEEFESQLKLTFWTDIIAGFPGETQKDHEKTIDVISQIRPDFTNVSKFASRPGTLASKMKQLDSNIVKERSRQLSLLCSRIAAEKNREWIGWSGPVIVDEYNRAKGNLIGRNIYYKPIALKGHFSLGSEAQVKITSSEKTCLLTR